MLHQKDSVYAVCNYGIIQHGKFIEMLKAVAKMDSQNGVPQSTYMIEECSELIKELTKEQRNKGTNSEILSEACDVLTTIFVLLMQREVSEDFVREQIIYKCERALARYKKMEKFESEGV